MLSTACFLLHAAVAQWRAVARHGDRHGDQCRIEVGDARGWGAAIAYVRFRSDLCNLAYAAADSKLQPVKRQATGRCEEVCGHMHRCDDVTGCDGQV